MTQSRQPRIDGAARFTPPAAGAGARAALDLPTIRMLARRSLVFWIAIRCALVIVPLFGGAPPVLPAIIRGSFADIATASVLTLLSPMTWAVAAAAGGLMVADVSATREAVFLAHLGIGRRHALAVGAAVAGCAETTIVLLIALVAAWI